MVPGIANDLDRGLPLDQIRLGSLKLTTEIDFPGIVLETIYYTPSGDCRGAWLVMMDSSIRI